MCRCARQTHRLEDVGSCLTMCAKTVSLVSSKKLLSVHPCVSVMQPQVVLAPTCHHPLVRSESKYASVSLHVYLLSVLSVFLSTRHVWFISLLVLIKKSPVSSVQIPVSFPPVGLCALVAVSASLQSVGLACPLADSRSSCWALLLGSGGSSTAAPFSWR